MKVPLLHVIATDEVATARGFASTAEDLIVAGRDRIALHLRLPRTDARGLHRLAERFSAAANDAGAWCVVNGRVDVALTARAQAVQLGSGALPVGAVRTIGGPHLIVGASVHSGDEARVRVREGADFLLAGAVYATTTHPDRVPAGPSLVTSCALAGVPVVGIGGIDAGNAERVVEAGAVGIAVIRAVWQRDDRVGAALQLIDLVSRWRPADVALDPGDGGTGSAGA